MVPSVGVGLGAGAACSCRGNKWPRSGLRPSVLTLPEADKVPASVPLMLGRFLCKPRQRTALNVTEQPKWFDYPLFSCFCRWAYVPHQHRVDISAHHRSKKHVRAMLPTFAEINSATIHLFNSACSRIAQGSVQHARRFLKAMVLESHGD